MGLFSSKSSSKSTTNLYDYSTNINADLSGGDLTAGASNNIISAGDVYYAGLSDELATSFLNASVTNSNAVISANTELSNNYLSAVNKSTDTLIDGAYDLTNNLLNAGIKSTDALVDGAIAITDQGYGYLKLLSNSASQLFNDTFGWIQQTIGSAQQQTELVSAQLAQAYNSEQATNSYIKTYALYGLIGFLAYVYFVKRK